MNRFLNLNKMAFTTYGSSMTIVRKENAMMGFNTSVKVPDGYYFHPIYDEEMFHGLLFRMGFEGEPSIGMEYEFLPESLRLFRNPNSVELCFPNRTTLRFSGRAKEGFFFLYDQTRKDDDALQLDRKHAELNIYTKKCMLYMFKGALSLEAP